ncbi:MAG: hypothetical protein CFH44_01134 [Proteobacteria bacterium]|nr:MAG: hypothetical protein CFH44_01134 [Pseudomonadota bacterium]|tara:strand:+ start:457 stop:801 length:345 start_codon:yes stop_codon:yes gene_type:complete
MQVSREDLEGAIKHLQKSKQLGLTEDLQRVKGIMYTFATGQSLIACSDNSNLSTFIKQTNNHNWLLVTSGNECCTKGLNKLFEDSNLHHVQQVNTIEVKLDGNKVDELLVIGKA